MKETLIHLIRHGSTRAIEKSLYCGHIDIDISSKGKKALLLAKNTYPPGDVFYTGTLKRTVTTLKLIYGDVDFIQLEELKEQNLGKLDMKSRETVLKDPLYIPWLKDTTGDVKCPGGESLNEFKLRVKLVFYKILKKGGGDLVIITHGSVIAVIMGSIFPGIKNFKTWQPAPGRGYTLLYKGYFAGYNNL